MVLGTSVERHHGEFPPLMFKVSRGDAGQDGEMQRFPLSKQRGCRLSAYVVSFNAGVRLEMLVAIDSRDAQNVF